LSISTVGGEVPRFYATARPAVTAGVVLVCALIVLIVNVID